MNEIHPAPPTIRRRRLGSEGSDGQQTRDFTYVTDVVEANVFAATHGLTGVFNVGRGDTIAIEELAQLVCSATGSQRQVVHQPARSGDIYASQADPSRLAREGYTLNTTLEQGIESTVGALH